MKKLLLLLASMVVVSIGGVSAQSVESATPKKITKLGDARWTVDLSAGTMVYQDLMLLGYNPENDVVPGGTMDRDIYTFPFHSSADIYYRFSRRFSLGLRTTMSYKQIECFDGHGELLGRFVGLPTTVVLTTKFSYYLGSEFEFYGLYGLGKTLMIVLEDYYWRPAPVVKVRKYFAECYPIGLRWGRKQGFFTEFGFGSKGLTNLGYFVNF
jgi:hypothetical protein